MTKERGYSVAEGGDGIWRLSMLQRRKPEQQERNYGQGHMLSKERSPLVTQNLKYPGHRVACILRNNLSRE